MHTFTFGTNYTFIEACALGSEACRQKRRHVEIIAFIGHHCSRDSWLSDYCDGAHYKSHDLSEKTVVPP